jgi:DNA-binding beta-propeller fold protein YncE
MRVLKNISETLMVLASLTAFAFSAQLRQTAVVELPGNPGFGQVAFANGYIVIAHGSENSLDVFDPQKRRVVTQVFGMHGPAGIAVDDQNGRVYVANAGDNTIAVVSSKDWKTASTINLQESPGPLQLAPGGKKLFVGNNRAQSISAIELDRDNFISTTNVGGSPRAMVFDPVRNVLLATLEDTREVIALDPSLRIAARYPLIASMPTGIALDAQARRMYVAVRSAVVALDADTGKEVKRVAAPAGVNSLWWDAADGVLYTAGGGSVMRISASNGRFEVEQELPVKLRGHTLAYDSDRKLIFVPGGQEGHAKLLIVRSIENIPGAPAPPTQSSLR